MSNQESGTDETPAGEPKFKVGDVVQRRASYARAVVERVRSKRRDGIYYDLSIGFASTLEMVHERLLRIVPGK